jgi:hypothetical protein
MGYDGMGWDGMRQREASAREGGWTQEYLVLRKGNTDDS